MSRLAQPRLGGATVDKPLPLDDELAGRSRAPRGDLGACLMRPAVLLFLAGALLLLLALPALLFWRLPAPGSAGGDPATVVHDPTGGMVVQFTVQTSPTSSSGGSLEQIERLDFHPGYVVARSTNGSGRVFFNNTTQSLSWSNGPESAPSFASRPAEKR
jgi:hypothetical protein